MRSGTYATTITQYQGIGDGRCVSILVVALFGICRGQIFGFGGTLGLDIARGDEQSRWFV